MYPGTLLTCSRNMGKHAAELDLTSPGDRKIFDGLLQDADIFIDGYRTGAMERLGYGPGNVAELANLRGKGIIYVSENCFGYDEHIDRPGWQQIADSVSLGLHCSQPCHTD